MPSDRFNYEKGDVQFGATQCALCKNYNVVSNEESACQCCKYPFGIPDEIIKGTSWCKHLELK